MAHVTHAEHWYAVLHAQFGVRLRIAHLSMLLKLKLSNRHLYETNGRTSEVRNPEGISI